MREGLSVAEPTPVGKIKHFTDLNVWQDAHALILHVYSLMDSFPDREKYALVEQFIRAAVSIPANIAEGCCTLRNMGGKSLLKQIKMGQGLKY